ncbi:ribosomal protein S18-alanine N-acetyltransferase [Pragia fontium]|uniref:[Ribosomal protein bS18]-alanine N-acetyltransferase n=2 Tax=Pragia fontium TaxID=82985 RepID=A0AAJ4W899_9GAMM|nr:ribosomal protein S18-alanine N-acetyltransferase [Pragia fontium]AKJ41281.1 ribosomal-protein-alanine acetyltransferase [Pragia fontium]SFC06525.1 ribosomal-protein-alanine N-acetyltransferase [Pragia fontium DSM 5563 = ATCC 49100]SUB81510.1 Protease synthase and sporulation negative regulatory protein PAI 1 [Pragia fontium]VEJ53881.1 Protease synthase and sporulation negative regulatory protein PAI 1 [Pragia fontium]GKX62827.1 ribosomal-protein-alanine acetyltransferase [Pragia fontium]
MNTISSLTPSDLTSVYQIELASHAFPWTEKTLLSNQGERYLNLKLCVDQAIAAFAITQVVLDEATLFNIAVHPDYQRRGIGRELLQALIDQLLERNVMTLWLEVRASNHAAIELYRSFDFNEVTVRKGYYPAVNGREDAIVMALTL